MGENLSFLTFNVAQMSRYDVQVTWCSHLYAVIFLDIEIFFSVDCPHQSITSCFLIRVLVLVFTVLHNQAINHSDLMIKNISNIIKEAVLCFMGTLLICNEEVNIGIELNLLTTVMPRVIHFLCHMENWCHCMGSLLWSEITILSVSVPPQCTLVYIQHT